MLVGSLEQAHALWNDTDAWLLDDQAMALNIQSTGTKHHTVKAQTL